MRACHLMRAWLDEGLKADQLEDTVRPFFNLMLLKGGVPSGLRLILPPFFKFLQNDEILIREECRRLFKTIFERLVALRGVGLIKEWKEFLQGREVKINNKYVCEWVKDKARKGPISDKNAWEKFQRKFVVPLHSVSHTTPQTCEITTRAGLVSGENKDFPSSVVVWNGNNQGRLV